jgi:hypothetical protein
VEKYKNKKCAEILKYVLFSKILKGERKNNRIEGGGATTQEKT